LLESFERATTKMLDRWSMMTYELPMSINDSKSNLVTSKKLIDTDKELSSTHDYQLNTKKSGKLADQMQMLSVNSNTTTVTSTTSINVINNDNMVPLRKYIWFHLNNIIKSDNTDVVIESSQLLSSKLNELLMRINERNSNYLLSDKNININSSQYMLNVNISLVTEKCVALRHKLNEFFSLLKSQLKTSEANVSSVNSTSFINLSNSNLGTPILDKTGNDINFI